ncbi:MAG TPA: hypothetical protein VLA36_09110, partial [Longimicrobiales bacterium]|nr:hypothetical protein [Longimicrobiales bacterium]
WRTGVLARSWVDCDRSAYPFPPSPACLAPDQVSFFGAVEFIRDSLPEDARFLAVKAEPLWYYSGRRSVFYPIALGESEAGFLPYLRSEGVDWILLGSLQVSEPRRFAELVQANCAGLRLAGTVPPRTYLFELRRDSAAAGEDLGACQAVADYMEANVGRDFSTE